MENNTSSYHGPFTLEANLSEEQIEHEDFKRVKSCCFTNGFILELCEVARKKRWSEKYLCDVIYATAPDANLQSHLKFATLRTKLTRLKTKKQKVKKGSKAYDELMKSIFDMNLNKPPTVVVPPVAKQIPLSPEKPQSLLSTPATPSNSISAHDESDMWPLSCSPSTCTQNKEANQIKYDINKKTKKLKEVEEKIAQKSVQLTMLGHYSIKNVNKRDKRAKDNASSLRNVKKILLKKEESEIKIKTEAESLRRRLKILQRKNQQLMMRLHTEQKKKKAAQKACSKLQIKLKEHTNCVPKSVMSKQVKMQAKEIRDLEVQLDTLADHHTKKTLSLKDDNGYSMETRMLINELTGLEIAQSKVGPAIAAIASSLFNCEVQQLPDRKTIQQINDEGHFIAKRYIATTLEGSTTWGLHKDGTTRKRRKILDTTVTTDKGQTMSLGFRQVASETGKAISEVAQEHLKELAYVSGEKESNFLENILQTLSVYMSDRASNEKKSNQFLDEWRREVLKDIPKDHIPEVHKFYCMAHVLLGFHKNVVSKVSSEQAQMGELGREKLPQFQNFRHDNIIERVPLMASEVFGPVGDHLGLRDLWEAHCANHAIKSRITSYKDNRFNGLFETSAQVLHHHKDFIYILSLRTSNKKLQSLLCDIQDPLVMTFCQAMAILFINVTGPFWNLMETGDVPYINLHSVIQPLHAYIEACIQEPALLLNASGPSCLEPFRGRDSEDYVNLLNPLHPEYLPELEKVLGAASQGLLHTIQTQLSDFLPTGIYGVPASKEDLHRTKFAHKTNLSCEHHFGDLDSSQRRRPHCTMHHHSTVQMLKRNRREIKKWYAEMTVAEKLSLWKDARSHAHKLRECHRIAEKAEQDKLYEVASRKAGTHEKQVKKDASKSSGKAETDELSQLKTQLEHMLPTSAAEFKMNQWVAVAYQDNWYPGLVRSESRCKSSLKVDFAARTRNPAQFKWPSGKDVQMVDKKFVLSMGFSLDPVGSGRAWSLSSSKNIDRIFCLFQEVYF